MLNKEISKLERRLKRLSKQRDVLLKIHSGNEHNYTYWGGYELGYIKGKIDEIENILDILNELK